MKLLDTNILIYSGQAEFYFLRKLFSESNVFVSDITRIETLGFHKITDVEKDFFDDVFNVLPSIALSEEIIQKAITLKQMKKFPLGDALIAATAIVKELTLITVNIKDFKDISELKIENPMI